MGEPTGAGELLFAPGVLGGEPGVEEGGEVSLNRFSLSDSKTYSARMVASSPGSSRWPPHFRAVVPGYPAFRAEEVSCNHGVVALGATQALRADRGEIPVSLDV